MIKHRIFIRAIFIGVPLALIISFFLAVPFQSQVTIFDRHSGLEKRHWIYFIYFRVTEESSGPGNIAAKYGTVTAPHTTYISRMAFRRFLWSETSKVENLDPGHSMHQLYRSLFGLVEIARSEGKNLPIGEARPIFERRVAIWNSRDVEVDPKKLLELIDQENRTVIESIAANGQ